MPDPLDGAKPLWQGPPARFPVVRGADGLVGFQAAVLVPGFVFALTSDRDDVPTGLPLVFGGFVAGVLAYLALRLFLRRRALRRTTYEVTDKGIRVCTGDRSTTHIWRYLPDARLRPGRDGTGSISFGSFPDPVETAADLGVRFRLPFYKQPERHPVVLWDVPDAKRLFAAITAAMKAARPAARGTHPPLTGPTGHNTDLEKLYRDMTR